MLFKDLCKRVDELREAGTDPMMKVGVIDHFGKLEDTFEGLTVTIVEHWRRGRSFIALDGVSSMYPEPD